MDLYRLLSEHPPAMQRAIAANWQIELSDPDPRQAALQLGDVMLASGAVAGRLATLSPEAREALALLAQSNGQATMKGLALRYGEVRRIGPGRLERDHPWDEAPSPLEELVYNGLAFRAFGAVPGGHGELLTVPSELLERLPPPARATPVFSVPLVATPAVIADERAALGEDILALLCHLRREQPAAAPDDDHVSPPEWLLGRVDSASQTLARRLLGASEPARLALVWRLLWRLSLIEEKRGRLRPSLAARDWLRAPDAIRASRLWRAWRDDPRVDELGQIAALSCDPGGCPHNPVTPRRLLAQFLRSLTPDSWHPPDSVVQALKRIQPTFLRPDGDLTSWFIRDSATGHYLRGVESWDRVEGALALTLLTRPMHWLGAVRLGCGAPDAAVSALGLTELGATLLGKPPDAPSKRTSPLATIDADGSIVVALEGSAYERYQLERIAVWQGQAETARYHLTEESVWEGYNAGITVEQMTAFLKRISADALPPSLELLLQAWAGRFGRATLRRATLLVLADESTARDLAKERQIAALVQETLSPTVWVIRASDLDELTAALKERGIWPQVEDDTR